MKADEPLADNNPLTLASAFLDAHGLAKCLWKADAKGYERLIDVKPTRLRHFLDEFFKYEESVYSNIKPEFIRSDVTLFLNKVSCFDSKGDPKRLRVTGSLLNDVFVQLRAICQAKVDRMPTWLEHDPDGKLPDPQNIVAFKNGLLNLEEDDVPPLDPTPQWFSQTVLPRNYDPDAKCPRTLQFLRDALGTDDQIALLQEWLGYLMTPDTSMQKMLMLLGVGGSGKGTLCRLMTDLIGKPNTTTFKLIDLQKEFTLSAWLGKSLAICREAMLGHLSDAHQIIEELLAIVGEDDRFVNVKNKSPLPSERMNARIVLAMNGFPQLPANGNQLRRRSLILSFDRSFAGNADNALYDKLVKELPGLTAWALEGLRRLRDQGDFTRTAVSEELLDRLCRVASPVKSFGEDCCVFSKPVNEPVGKATRRSRELKRFVFETWRIYQAEKGYKGLSDNTFSEKFTEAFPTVKAVRVWHGKKRVQCFEGVELESEWFERISSDRKQMTFEEMEVRQGREDGDTDVHGQ